MSMASTRAPERASMAVKSPVPQPTSRQERLGCSSAWRIRSRARRSARNRPAGVSHPPDALRLVEDQATVLDFMRCTLGSRAQGASHRRDTRSEALRTARDCGRPVQGS